MISYVQSLLANFVSAYYHITTRPPPKKKKLNFLLPVPLGQICFVLVLNSPNHKARNRYPEMVMARTVFQLSAEFVVSKSSWAGGLSCVILSVAPAFAIASCLSVAIVSFFRTVSVTPNTMFSCEGIVLISAFKCYINCLVFTNVRPSGFNTQTRLLLNNAHCYTVWNFKVLYHFHHNKHYHNFLFQMRMERDI